MRCLCQPTLAAGVAAACVAASGFFHPAAAQGQSSETEAQAIVITGEKVRRDRQQTHTSVGVISGQQIEDLGIADLRSGLRLLPNVNSSPSNNGNNGITIRGINSEGVGTPGGNLRPLTALVIDGATQSFEGVRRGARGLWDMEQVEVFRGPQSSLQGRNALAGAVVLRSRDPTFFFEGAATATLGSDDQREVALMLSAPVIPDQLAVRLASEQIREQHGILYSDPRLNDLDDGLYRSTRLKLLAKPKALPGFGAKLTLSESFDSPAVTAVSGPDYFSRTLRQAAPGIERRENDVASRVLELEWTFAPRWSLTSVTSGVQTQTAFRTPTDLYVRDEFRIDKDASQDLRIAYDGGEAMTLVAGIFVGRFDNSRDSVVRFRLSPDTPLATIQSLDSNSSIRNLGIYAEARRRFFEVLTLTAGVRRDSESFREFFNNRLNRQTEDNSVEFRATLPKLAAVYDLSPTKAVGVTVSRGYRAGLLDNGRLVRPEYLTATELSIRSQWLQRKLTVNANAFRYRWTGQQINARDPGNPLLAIITNAGRSSSRGLEVEGGWRVTPGLQLVATLGLLRTRFDDYRTDTGDFTGNEFPEAPRASASLQAVWRAGNGFFATADWSYKSGFFATSDLANQRSLRVPWSGLANLRMGWEAEAWSVVGSVDNVADTAYLTGRDQLLGAYVGDRRRAAVRFSLRY